MAKPLKIAFVASNVESAQAALAVLSARYGAVAPEKADIIVALGGDGFMLHSMHEMQHLSVPIYGMNRGTVGFLMNAYDEDELDERLAAAAEEVINPLVMQVECRDGTIHTGLAINEVSVLRSGQQAAKLRISVDGKLR